MKQNYTAIWTSPGGSSLANVSFTASSPEGIKREVRQIAKQIGFKSSTCEVWQGGNLVARGIE